MSYVIWDGSNCVMFSSKRARQAWDYVMNHKSIPEEWHGWVDSVTAGNHVAVINQFDTVLPYDNSPPYLQPSLREQPNANT